MNSGNRSNVNTKRFRGPTRAETAPTTHFLGQTVSVTAVPYLVSAVKTARRIEVEALKFDPNGNNYRQLEGLKRKLFMDDYAYAALIPGSGVNRKDWEAAFAKLDEQTVPEKTAALPVIEGAAGNLANYYGGIVKWGHTSAYSNIVSVLGKYTEQNPLETDLFKDAAAYACLRDNVDEWIKQDQEDTKKWLAGISKRFPDGKLPGPNYLPGYVALQANHEADLARLKGAYQNVFTYRFAERDGLTNLALITDLNAIILQRAGPELIIPPEQH